MIRSLQATWIRNTILGAIRQTNPSAAKRLPMNVAFAFPTIAALAEAVSGVDLSARAEVVCIENDGRVCRRLELECDGATEQQLWACERDEPWRR